MRTPRRWLQAALLVTVVSARAVVAQPLLGSRPAAAPAREHRVVLTEGGVRPAELRVDRGDRIVFDAADERQYRLVLPEGMELLDPPARPDYGYDCATGGPPQLTAETWRRYRAQCGDGSSNPGGRGYHDVRLAGPGATAVVSTADLEEREPPYLFTVVSGQRDTRVTRPIGIDLRVDSTERQFQVSVRVSSPETRRAQQFVAEARAFAARFYRARFTPCGERRYVTLRDAREQRSLLYLFEDPQIDVSGEPVPAGDVRLDRNGIEWTGAMSLHASYYRTYNTGATRPGWSDWGKGTQLDFMMIERRHGVWRPTPNQADLGSSVQPFSCARVPPQPGS